MAIVSKDEGVLTNAQASPPRRAYSGCRIFPTIVRSACRRSIISAATAAASSERLSIAFSTWRACTATSACASRVRKSSIAREW